jgi:hypothetical protein
MLIMIICELELTEFGSARAFILGFISNGTPSRPVNEERCNYNIFKLDYFVKKFV